MRLKALCFDDSQSLAYIVSGIDVGVCGWLLTGEHQRAGNPDFGEQLGDITTRGSDTEWDAERR